MTAWTCSSVIALGFGALPRDSPGITTRTLLGFVGMTCSSYASASIADSGAMMRRIVSGARWVAPCWGLVGLSTIRWSMNSLIAFGPTSPIGVVRNQGIA